MVILVGCSEAVALSPALAEVVIVADRDIELVSVCRARPLGLFQYDEKMRRLSGDEIDEEAAVRPAAGELGGLLHSDSDDTDVETVVAVETKESAELSRTSCGLPTEGATRPVPLVLVCMLMVVWDGDAW